MRKQRNRVGIKLAVLAIGLLIGPFREALPAQTIPGARGALSTSQPQLIDLSPLLETLKAQADRGDAASEPAMSLHQYARKTEAGPSSLAQPSHLLLLPFQADRAVTDHVMRLTGERQTAHLTLDIPALKPVEGVQLRYRNSINVQSSQSRILINVNGTPLPAVAPAAFEGFKTISVPSNLLVEGRNTITVQAKQAHRIFCGPKASFQIWTEFDLAQSGAIVSSTNLPTDANGFRMALAAQVGRYGRVTVRAAGEPPQTFMRSMSEKLSAASAGTQAITLVTEGLYANGAATHPIARITLRDNLPTPLEVRRGADGAEVLMLNPKAKDVLSALDKILPQSAPVPDIGKLMPGVATSLKELQFTDLNAYNRYTEQSLQFRLPNDWLILSSAKATLRLSYGFAADLPQGALMLVKVDGVTVRLLPLDTNGGKVQPPLDIRFPANILKSGVNNVTFVTIAPGNPPDRPCPKSDTPLMTILDGSSLLVPSSPRMKFIGMNSLVAALRPNQLVASGSAALQSHIEKLTTTLASSLRPISGIPPISDAQLKIVALDNLQNVSLGKLGVQPRTLENVFFGAPDTRAQASIENPDYGFFNASKLLFSLEAIGKKISDLAQPGDPPLKEWLANRRGKAALVLTDPKRPHKLSLIVPPNSDAAQIADAIARARLSSNAPRGQFSLLTEDGKWENWQDASAPPVLEEPLSLGNFRAVAGNFASWSPLYFVLLLFGLTVLSIVLALVFVISTRGKRKK
ncbi:cellulose biosynthesis cyclic di-GMP-binding regulatory protein BcsB [Thioclava sp. ES.031]|uniref:cellulose biosynthesis cyclic di-GMP-binding regulatory protein BcsB n=1 Tax=Thioclava sp. ES.031 TaxID=1798203 RepID=UPI000BF637D8|nr:cellulose biosynthesis cyclic di-GMP-binding regulatory protein BcsB [Thioclava sp. ES.031]